MSTTIGGTTGLHLEETTAPNTAANVGALYTKDTSGQPELFFREENDGDEIQITSGGELAGGGGRLFGISDDLLTNTRVVDTSDISVTTTAADVGSATAAQTIAAGDIIALWIVSQDMLGSGISYSYGIEVNSTDYIGNHNPSGTTMGRHYVHPSLQIQGMINSFRYVGTGGAKTQSPLPVIYYFDVNALGISTGSQAIQVRVKEDNTSAGGTLRGSAGTGTFDTIIAWALLKGT